MKNFRAENFKKVESASAAKAIFKICALNIINAKAEKMSEQQ